jgi:hypothetical protein
MIILEVYVTGLTRGKGEGYAPVLINVDCPGANPLTL